MPKFQKFQRGIKKSGWQKYQANVIKGNLDEFELSNSDNLIGSLPEGNFSIDLEIDRAVSKVTSISKINFATLSSN